MLTGTYTALTTPLTTDGHIDEEGLEQLIAFQLDGKVSGLVPIGTTGESPTLSEGERRTVVERVCRRTGSQARVLVGAGSNATAHALAASEHAADSGADGVLLVDPYYNGPSSLEIRCEYIAPIAERCPELTIVPYVVPGRTGTQLAPADLGLLVRQFANVRGVKEASGDLANAALTRQLCGPEFAILSGDDDINLTLMRTSEIAAAGAISVIANIAPAAVERLTQAALQGDWTEAERLDRALAPLTRIVHVETNEETPLGPVRCRARSPLPIKTLMRLLGMPAGPCRAPLGRMTELGVEVLCRTVRELLADDASLLTPIEYFFGVDIAARLADRALLATLSYPQYCEQTP